MKPVFIALTALALAGCAASGPPLYSAADKDGFGYSERQIESDRYQIVYRGSAGMQPNVVQNYGLRRAAELSLTNGYDWFHVVTRQMVKDQRGGVDLGLGVGTGSYGRHTGVGVGVGTDIGRVGAKDYVTLTMEVIMGHGKRPEGGDVYVAADVLRSLGTPQ